MQNYILIAVLLAIVIFSIYKVVKQSRKKPLSRHRRR